MAAISEEAKRRIREAVSRALLEEVSAQPLIGNSESAKTSALGPWSSLSGGSSAWEAPVRANPELFRQMHGVLSDTAVKEVLLAAAGVKVARLSLFDSEVQTLRLLADQYGFSALVGEERYLPRRDVGKGNYCNAFERLAEADESGVRNVYVASDVSLAQTAELLAEAGDDELFGALLGIPACCRETYERFCSRAREKQFDLMPLVLENSQGSLPFDFWLNYAAVYFGGSLLSFFPCSFRCVAAHTVATHTYKILADCNEEFAQKFVKLQQSNILYTEYNGVHLFRRPLVDGWIHYEIKDVTSTEPTELATLLRRGDRLRVHSPSMVQVYLGTEQLALLQGEDIGMFAFY